jgi:hypothetical protein
MHSMLRRLVGVILLLLSLATLAWSICATLNVGTILTLELGTGVEIGFLGNRGWSGCLILRHVRRSDEIEARSSEYRVRWSGPVLKIRRDMQFFRNSDRFRHVTEISIRDWILVLIAFAFPVLYMLVFSHKCHRFFRRFTHGLCVHCGYDLRASTERCPECGQPIAQPQSVEQTPPR